MQFKTVNFEYVRSGRTDGIVILRDLGPWDDFKTITNAPEWVVEKVCNEHPSTKRLLYYDSDGRLDEIRFENGRFKSFLPCPPVEELLDLKEREEEAKGKEILAEMKRGLEENLKIIDEAHQQALKDAAAQPWENILKEENPASASWFPQMEHVADVGRMEGGATKRDVFAAFAMAGFCAHKEIGQEHPGKIAQLSWEQADEMLKPKKEKVDESAST